jgi:hypothetical protein
VLRRSPVTRSPVTRSPAHPLPDTRAHRGPHPEDAKLFGADQLPALRAAVAELSWLLSREYAQPSALKLVGDRHRLDARQRVAVMRCACSDDARAARDFRRVPVEALRGAAVDLDGYNVVTTVEAALGGGVILGARDGTFRDVAAMHGTFRRVEETVPAAERVGATLAAVGAGRCTWFLDSPVSNSGRLRQVLLDVAGAHGWDWAVEVVPDADAAVGRQGAVVASADSVVLDRCGAWVSLARAVVEERVPDAWVIEYIDEGGRSSCYGSGTPT